MRSLALTLSVLAAGPAAAQTAISGTLSGAFEAFGDFGTTKTRITLDLQCSLTCDATAPDKRFGVFGGTNATFASAPSETTGYVQSGFGSDPTGRNSYVSEQFTAGSAFVFKAKSATCQCGNRTGEGGYIDLASAVVAIPPYVSAAFALTAGQGGFLLVSAKPKGAETVELRLVGSGLDVTRVLTAADFPGSTTSKTVEVAPTAAGPLSVTATLTPHGASRTITVDVAAGSGTGSGGGTGGGSGGGSGGGGEEPQGCTATALTPALALALALLRRGRAVTAG